jgi:hypothetical protein
MSSTTKRACLYVLAMLLLPGLAPLILLFLFVRWLINKGDK